MINRVAFVAAAMAFAVPAHAQSTVDPDHLITVLKDAGFPAEYFSEAADYRQILVSKPGNHQFLIELYDCETGKTCDTLEFFVGFPMENPPTKAVLDGYSGPRQGAEISLDRRGKPRMVLSIDVPDEGLTDALFLAQVQNWETMMNGFYGFLTGKPVPAEATPAAAEPAAPAPPAAPASS